MEEHLQGIEDKFDVHLRDHKSITESVTRCREDISRIRGELDTFFRQYGALHQPDHSS